MTTPGLVHRVAARDRALLERIALGGEAAAMTRLFWTCMTHAGGAATTLALSLGPLWLAEGAWRDGAVRSTAVLIVSHLMVQVLKRSFVRPRPALASHRLPRAPDQFSFPSGHSAAALAVALGYSSAMPDFAAPFLVLAALTGASRVVLGVHYPVDVVAGQIITLCTAALCAVVL